MTKKNHSNCLTVVLLVAMENQNVKIEKKYLKYHLLRNHMLYEAETLWKYSPYYTLQGLCSYEIQLFVCYGNLEFP